jgi:hypothetical protein
VRLVLVALLAVSASAHAEDEASEEEDGDAWESDVEAGAEYDSNVQRIEVDPESGMEPIAAPAARVGAKFAGAGERGWGRWTVAGQGLARLVGYPEELGENVGVLAGEGRWDRPAGQGTARVGVRASYYDVLPLLGGAAARAFAIGGADGLVVLAGPDGERFALTAGYRDFRYKPDEDFDWRGLAAALRLVVPVGGGVDVSAGYRLERRSFRGLAFTSGCAPTDPVEPSCFVPTELARSDLHHVGEVELIYTGDVVVGGGYQLTFNDSSSYGQSLVRHRLTASVTAGLPGRVFATAIATLQLDQYLDPLLLARDVANQTFTSIDDENRSALSLRLSRKLRGGWAAEGRWAFYADSLSPGSTDDLEFRRHLVYGGVTWASD